MGGSGGNDSTIDDPEVEWEYACLSGGQGRMINRCWSSNSGRD